MKINQYFSFTNGILPTSYLEKLAQQDTVCIYTKWRIYTYNDLNNTLSHHSSVGTSRSYMVMAYPSGSTKVNCQPKRPFEGGLKMVTPASTSASCTF